MSETYRYTGWSYSSFSSGLVPNNEFSATNSIVVTITIPTALPANLGLGYALPPGTVVSIGDGKRHYDDVAPGQGEYITLSVQLSTGPTGEITAWNIDLNDNGLEIDGPPITTSYELHTSAGLPEPATPEDWSLLSLNPTGVWFQGMTGMYGTWRQQ